jgi:hypothetical protein
VLLQEILPRLHYPGKIHFKFKAISPWYEPVPKNIADQIIAGRTKG